MLPAKTDAARSRRHLLIAGTGRTGTSALVQYLTGLGLETHLTKHGDAAHWNDLAQAGLEDLPLFTDGRDLPYVIKSPWSYQFIDQILSTGNIQLDAILVPIRDLLDAAASRSIVQLQAMHRSAEWLTEVITPWEHWGETPGGSIFSLNPVDQARLIALGLHQLLERAAHVDVPIVLLAFPRFATDHAYLIRKLRPVLPILIDEVQARAVHTSTFRAEKVRTNNALNNSTKYPSLNPNMIMLDNAALKREIERLRNELATLRMSRSWRLSAPARAIVDSVRRSMRRIVYPGTSHRESTPEAAKARWWKS